MKIYFIILEISLCFVTAYAKEPRFLKSFEYIKSSDYNKSVQYEMKQVVNITQQMFKKNISLLMEKAVMGRQYSNCIKLHLSNNDFIDFTNTIEEEVYKQKDLTTYKHNVIRGNALASNFFDSFINYNYDLSLEDYEKYYNQIYSCEKVKRYSINKIYNKTE